jgi:Tfp pilus assembly protein PilX
MDNDSTKLLQEIYAETKGARLYSVLIMLAVIGFCSLTMVMVQEVRIELRALAAQSSATAPAK